MANHFEGQNEQTVLDRAHVLHDAISVAVYGPADPENCASSWEAAKLIASLELRVAELEKWVKALTAENKRLRIGLDDPS